MINKILIALLAAIAASSVFAQGPPIQKQSAQEYDTAPFVPAPTVPNASVAPTAQGSATCYYWIITKIAGPPAAISAPLSIPLFICPTTAGGTAQNPVSLQWGAVSGATYDILETTTSTLPVGTNTVAIATGLTTTTLTDSGQARSSYTLLPAGLNWQEFNNLIAGIPTLQFCYNGTCPFAITPTGTVGGGTVTSVGLAVNDVPQLTDTITNSPVTTSGTLTVLKQWNPAPKGYFLGVSSSQNAIGGVVDGATSASGNNTAPTATVNIPPSPNNHELAFNMFTTQNSIQTGAFSMPGGWNQQFANGTQGGVFSQVFTGTGPITAPVTLTTADVWTDTVFILRLPAGNPTFVQKVTGGGAFSTQTNAFAGNVTAGNSILVLACWQNGTSAANFKVTDALLNTYTTFTMAGSPFCAAALAANITGGTTDAVTLTGTGISGTAFFYQQELSNLSAASAVPSFIPITNGDLSTAGIAGPPISVFSQTSLANSTGGDVAVAATTATNVMTRTVTMPAQGCPCRVFAFYELYVTTAASGVGYSAWVNDGISSNFAGSNQGQSNGSSGALVQLNPGQPLSPNTYNNGANVTFTLVTEGDHAYTVKGSSQLAGNAPNSTFAIAITTSN